MGKAKGHSVSREAKGVKVAHGGVKRDVEHHEWAEGRTVVVLLLRWFFIACLYGVTTLHPRLLPWAGYKQW